jgi:glycyl-tRNA synthetase
MLGATRCRCRAATTAAATAATATAAAATAAVPLSRRCGQSRAHSSDASAAAPSPVADAPLESMEPLLELARRRGFVYPCSDIYGGMANTYDFGPLGSQLRANLRRLWWRDMVLRRPDTVGLESAVILHPEVWRAAGHVENFSDPMVDCRECKARLRADHLPAGSGCPVCGAPSTALTEPRDFNLLFRTQVGPTDGHGTEAYLRPETAQGIFVHFANIVASSRSSKLPLGVGQIGKAFRNEISPGQFLFRTREFEQMELEYFVNPAESAEWFRYWVSETHRWLQEVAGLSAANLRLEEHAPDDLAHYALSTTDIEFNYPSFGWGELWGIANRGSYDLEQHAAASGAKSLVMDGLGEGGKGKGVPHVIEPSVGLDRLMLAVLADAYVVETAQESGGGGGKGGGAGERVVLRLATDVAPVRAAVLPLKSNHAEMVELATQLQATLAVSDMTARPTHPLPSATRASTLAQAPATIYIHLPSTSTFCFVFRVAVCASLSHPGCVCMSLYRPRQSSWLK